MSNQTRFKYLVRNIVAKSSGIPSTFIGLENVESETGQLILETETKSASDSLVAEPGDVLFGKLRPYLAKTYSVSEQLTCSNEFLVLRSTTLAIPRFVEYLTRSRPWIDWASATSYGSKMPRTSAELMGNLRVTLPSSRQQMDLVSYLDRETAKIDALIAKQEQLIATLREDRAATVTHAVARGLDPAAHFKESEVVWFGPMPDRWQSRRFKQFIASMTSGTSVNGADSPAGQQEVGVLKTSCVSGGYFNPEENKAVIDEDLLRVTCPVVGGSLIVNRANTPNLVGGAGYVAKSWPNLYLSDKLWLVTLRDCSEKYVYYWMETEAYRSQILARCVGASASMQSLSMADFLNITVPLPELEEQREIVAYLDTHCAKVDALIDKSTEMIATLREYRSALITNAVTGKIDVREAV